MVGNVGDDNFGRDYFEALGKEGINADGVSTVKGETTGAANIVVEEETGENRIMFTPGANVAFSKEYDQGWDLVPSDAGIVVFQLEIPIDVVCFNKFIPLFDGQCTYSNIIVRFYTTCISLKSKASIPCSTQHLLFRCLKPHTKTSTP